MLLSYQVNEAFAGPKARKRRKTKKGIGIIFCRADNYAVAKEIQCVTASKKLNF